MILACSDLLRPRAGFRAQARRMDGDPRARNQDGAPWLETPPETAATSLNIPHTPGPLRFGYPAPAL